MDVLEITSSATGQVMRIYEDRVDLTQTGAKGFFSQGLAGTKTYYFCDITTIQFKNCGWSAGFIEFTFAGGRDGRGGVLIGANNDNRFVFGKSTIRAAKKLAVEMEKVNACLQERLRQAKAAKTAPAQNVVQISSADEILKFKNLLDQGIITQEEFEAKKKELLKT